MGSVGTAGQLGVELGSYEEGVRGNFQDLHDLLVGGHAGEHHAFVLDEFPVLVVELVPVTESFHDRFRSVAPVGRRTRFHLYLVSPQPHRTAHARQFALAGQQVDDRRVRFGVEFRVGRFQQSALVSRELHHRQLESVAQAQERQAVLPGVLNEPDLALGAPLAETAGYDDAGYAVQQALVKRLVA